MDPDGSPRGSSLLRLETEVGALVRRVRRVVRERAQMVDASLLPASYLLLLHLDGSGPQRAADLAEALDVDKGAISRQVAHLIALGLVSKAKDPDDGRALRLTLTPAARERLEEVRQARLAWVGEQLGDWSPDELADFVTLLERYNRALDEPDA